MIEMIAIQRRKKALIKALDKNENYYILEFNNLGGLVTPIPLQIIYEDGSEELVRIPAGDLEKKTSQISMAKKNIERSL